MSQIEGKESGASEVIGAVLLVSLVVIGGAVIAAYTFGQPTPKEVPHVNFGVSLDNRTQNLTLHHTGGDTLLPGEYNVTVYDTYGVPHAPGDPADTSIEWSADESMNITKVTYAVGDVVLSYIDGAGGETVLRRVPFEDHSLRGVISGYKYNVTGGQKVPWSVANPPVVIKIYRKEGSTYTGVYSGNVDASGHYSYTLPIDEWGVYRVEEVCPAGYEPVSPPHGTRQVDVTTSSPSKTVDFENRLLPEPVINPAISIAKVTKNGTAEGDGLTIEEFSPISWKYTVTNTGDVALNNIRVVDDHRDVTPAPVLGADNVHNVGDINGDGWLNLTEIWTYTATGTAIEGGYSNTGTATGTPPQGADVSASDTSSYSGTPVVLTPTTISGIKYRVDENNQTIGGEPGITITLKLVEPWSLLPVLQAEPYLFSNQGVKTTTTGADGSYTFLVPDVTATYRLTETGLDPKVWFIQGDADGGEAGVIEGVVPGATGRTFYNYLVPGNGIVMYLDKAVDEGCPGGYVVNGTTLEGEARNSDTVKFMIGGEEQTYRFSNGEQFRFTIWGDQNLGEVMIDQFEMTSLTFTVKFEVRPDRDSPWVTPTTRQFNPTGQDVIGPTTEVSIDAINKNLLNEDSTLAYRHPTQCSDNQTLLRLNGEIRIDANPDDTYLEFTNLHEVHDNRYGEGLNTMWIYLMPDRDYILAQGVCVYP